MLYNILHNVDLSCEWYVAVESSVVISFRQLSSKKIDSTRQITQMEDLYGQKSGMVAGNLLLNQLPQQVSTTSGGYSLSLGNIEMNNMNETPSKSGRFTPDLFLRGPDDHCGRIDFPTNFMSIRSPAKLFSSLEKQDSRLYMDHIYESPTCAPDDCCNTMLEKHVSSRKQDACGLRFSEADFVSVTFGGRPKLEPCVQPN